MKIFSPSLRTSLLALCLALLTLFVWQQSAGFKATSHPVAAAAPVSGGTQRLTTAEQVPEELQRDDWQSIRRAYEKQRHAVVAVAGGQQARNPGAWQWGLELDSYGFAAAPAVHIAPRVAVRLQCTATEFSVSPEYRQCFSSDLSVALSA